MCGIASIFAYHNEAPPVDREALLRIRDHMLSRGPDGEGLWISDDQRIGLAHRPLSIIDLTVAGAQPMTDPATEVLLKLYAVYGQQMLHQLRGMFAFAIWDQQKRAVFLARDLFGVKPLYLADDGKTLRFASQVKALLAGGGIDTSPEAAGHVGFLILGSVPEPFTLHKGIRALPAGHYLWLEAGGRSRRQSYFNLAEIYAQPAMTTTPTHDEARELLHEALRDSVRHHLMADVPGGVFLSAGLDSTTAAALAKETGVTELRTLTLGFSEFANTDNDEVPLAEAVSIHLGALHHTQWVGRDGFAEQIEICLRRWISLASTASTATSWPKPRTMRA